MIRLFTTLGILLVATWSLAQQAPQYTMYMLNPYGFNPGYAGLDNSLSITGVYRNQWVNLVGSPETQQINAHLPFYFLGGGLGIKVENDMAGASRNTSASLAYSYWLPVNKKSILSVGLEAGIVQRSLDGQRLRTPEGTFVEGNYLGHNDNFLPFGTVSALAPTVNVGAYYHNERIDAGISVTNLIEPQITLEFDNQSTNIQLIRNYFLTFGLNLDLGTNWTVRPSTLIRSDLAQTEIHFSSIVQYNDNILGGASFRGYNSNTVDAIAILAGLKLNERLTLAYSYDLTLSNLNAVSSGSHEVMLNYNLNQPIGKGLPPQIIYNTRYR